MLAFSCTYSNDENNQTLSCCDRPAERANIVLPRKWLLRIVTHARIAGLRRILDREARIQRRRPLVEGAAAMPVIGSALGRDHDRSRRGSARVGVFLGRAHRKFLNRVRREILQKSANPIVGVVAAIDGKIVVQSGTSAGRNRRDARLGRIGRLDRFCSRRQIGDVGEAARRQRKGLQDPGC